MSKVKKKIAVAGCKHTTMDLVLGLAKVGICVDHVITLSPEKAADQNVAGYYDLSAFLEEREIPCIIADKYSLKSPKDEETILAAGIDLLLVMGWQRLIPDWLLNSLSVGAFGMHGSNKPLPHGRGRSPMNWSLIQGKTLFFTHLFQYLPGADDGPVVDVQLFDITPFDDAHTLHFKNLLSMVRLCARAVPALLDGTASFAPQPKEGVSYYPKRSAEDGLIYWSDSSSDIYNLIRAVTTPFPGAFSYLDNDADRKLTIRKAVPFDSHLTWPQARPGEVVEVFYDGSFLVRTGDTSLYVSDYEGERFSAGHQGLVFGVLGTPRKIWENLPS